MVRSLAYEVFIFYFSTYALFINLVTRFQTFGDSNPHRPPEDVAFAVARFFEKGGSVQNYYVVCDSTSIGSLRWEFLRNTSIKLVDAKSFSFLFCLVN